MPADQQCTIALCYMAGTDESRYNLPRISNEIAAIIPGNESTQSNEWDIILHCRAGEPFRRISELHPFYPALYYVLLFPTGQLGWQPGMPYNNWPGKISMREFLAYHFHPWSNESNH